MKQRCVSCGKPLSGNQRRFCSRLCLTRDVNLRHKDYKCQRRRGQTRRRELINRAGGGCTICGYNRNQAALVFHHKNRMTKAFGIDIRQCSNRAWSVLVAEADKCTLLCHNCHNELEHPELLLIESPALTS